MAKRSGSQKFNSMDKRTREYKNMMSEKPLVNEPAIVQPQPQVENLPATQSDKIDQILKQNELLSRKISILEDSVSRYKLEQATSRHDAKKDKPLRGHLKRLQGKVIARWMGVNEEGSRAKQELVYLNNAIVGEKLVGHYKTIGGEDIICDAIEFTRSNRLEKFTILSQDGDILTIKFDDNTLPQEYKIDVKYVNP